MTLGVHQVSPSVPKCRQVSPSVTNLGVFKAPRRARGAPKECHAGSMTLFWRPPGAPGCLEHPQVGDTSRHLATLGDTWPVPPRATGRKLSAKADGSHPSAFLAARRNIYIYIYTYLQVSPSVTKCHQVSASVSKCQQVSASVTKCHQVSPSVIIQQNGTNLGVF